MLANNKNKEHKQSVTSADIMKATMSLIQGFHQKIDGILANMRDCTGRLNEAEEHISSAEDTINHLQSNVKNLCPKRNSNSLRTFIKFLDYGDKEWVLMAASFEIHVSLTCVRSLRLSPSHQGCMERHKETRQGEKKRGNMF